MGGGVKMIKKRASVIISMALLILLVGCPDPSGGIWEQIENAGFESAFDTPFFNEFVLKAPVEFEQKRTALINGKCIFAGVKLEPFYPEFKQHFRNGKLAKMALAIFGLKVKL